MEPPVKSVVVLILAFACAGASGAGGDVNRKQGKQLFTQDTTPACGICHALADAETAGTIGPSLDEMKPDAERVARVIRSGIGAMPPYPQLTDEQVKTLAEYVAHATGGKK
jgi:cytochrome c6